MSHTNILTIAGIFISSIFGAWGIYVALKQRFQREITFIREQSIALFDTIVKNLPELSVKYKDSPVKPNLVLIIGALVNSGKSDISPPSIIEQPIRISLPEGYKWLTSKVISSSENVEAEIKVENDNNLVLDNGLFMQKEYIRFQALAEVPIEDSNGNKNKHSLDDQLEESLKFSHRIADLHEIKKLKLKEKKYLYRTFRTFLFTAIASFLFFVFSLTSSIFIMVNDEKIVYNYLTDDSKIIKVEIVSQRNQDIKIKEIDTAFKKTLTASEFFKRCQGYPSLYPKSKSRIDMLIIMFLGIAYFIFPGAMSLMSLLKYHEYRSNVKLRKMLNID